MPRWSPSSLTGVESAIKAALLVKSIEAPSPWTALNIITSLGVNERLVERGADREDDEPDVVDLYPPRHVRYPPDEEEEDRTGERVGLREPYRLLSVGVQCGGDLGRPTITILSSIPDMRTPTVVTVSTVHLYSIFLR